MIIERNCIREAPLNISLERKKELTQYVSATQKKFDNKLKLRVTQKK